MHIYVFITIEYVFITIESYPMESQCQLNTLSIVCLGHDVYQCDRRTINTVSYRCFFVYKF